MDIMSIFSALSVPFQIVGDSLKGWQERCRLEAEGALRIKEAETQATIARLQRAQEGEIEWENKALETAGWKDEWFVLLLSVPAVLCFIPGYDVIVKAGFESLNETPEWYRWSFILAVSASFGYRKLVDYFTRKQTDGGSK